MKRYRGIFSMIITLLCALVILGAGYAGIAIGGEEMLKTSQEPEEITMSGDISNLFYSRIEDDVQLHPWNNYAQENEHDGDIQAKDELGGTEEILYTLIAVMADVEIQEVIRWYNSQDKSILEDVVTRYAQEEELYYFFYDDVIRLNGREYHVKFCMDMSCMYSFSCLRTKDGNVRDSEEWNENKEILRDQIEKYDSTLVYIWQALADMRWDAYDMWNWGLYVEICQMLDFTFYGFNDDYSNMRNDASDVYLIETGEEKQESVETDSKISVWEEELQKQMEGQEFDPQMVELDDCILLMSGQYQMPAVYYDVMEQKVAGFHFFY